MKVTLKNVTKKYGSTTAVNNFSAELPDGQLICLLGPSGCGKSTLLNMMCGITDVTEGSILFDGNDVTKVSPDKRNIGMVFQNYALYPHMTVLENICFPLEIKKIPKQERIQKAEEIAKKENGCFKIMTGYGSTTGSCSSKQAAIKSLTKISNSLKTYKIMTTYQFFSQLPPNDLEALKRSGMLKESALRYMHVYEVFDENRRRFEMLSQNQSRRAPNIRGSGIMQAYTETADACSLSEDRTRAIIRIMETQVG